MRKVHKKIIIEFFIKHQSFYQFDDEILIFLGRPNENISIWDFSRIMEDYRKEGILITIFVKKTMDLLVNTEMNSFLYNAFSRYQFSFKLTSDYRRTKRIFRIMDKHFKKYKEVAEFMSL